MVNEQALKDTLIYLVKAAKKSTQIEATLFIEVGVLRATVRALDPTFLENYEFKKKEIAAMAHEQTEYLEQKFDEIIQLLNQGHICGA
jgi:hypothetical protein